MKLKRKSILKPSLSYKKKHKIKYVRFLLPLNHKEYHEEFNNKKNHRKMLHKIKKYLMKHNV